MEKFLPLCALAPDADDLLDWNIDGEAGCLSGLLCEAERLAEGGRISSHEDGTRRTQWVKAIMDSWMKESVRAANGLDSPAVVNYLHMRRDSFSLRLESMLQPLTVP